jgi:peptidoglycan/xylan/chitin deacetylase (PgdA/CDA1 family)
MQKPLIAFLSITGGWVPLQRFIKMTGQDFLFPFYHTVSSTPLPHVDQVYPVRSLPRFLRDLDFLTRHYRPVGLEELRAFREGRKISSRPCMFLTFDDGLSGLYDTVAPELIKRGIPAAFFLNPDFLDNRGLFFRYKASLLLDRLASSNYAPALLELFQRRYHLTRAGKKEVRAYILGVSYRRREELDTMARMVDVDYDAFLKVRKPYLTSIQVMELARSGFYIGAHGSDHPLFADLSLDEQLSQYRDSLSRVQQEFGLPYGLFSFPFTDDGVSSSFFTAITGEEMPEMDATFGTAGLKKDPVEFHYQRVPMESDNCPASLRLKGEYAYYLLKGLIGRNTITRK